MINVDARTATVWGTGDEPFNLTTVDDTARFAAKIATDPSAVAGVHYLSGAQTTFNAIIRETECSRAVVSESAVANNVRS